MNKTQVTEQSVPIRCLINVLDAMERRQLTAADLAQRVKIEEPLLRGALISRVSLDDRELSRLARALGMHAQAVSVVGLLSPEEIYRILA